MTTAITEKTIIFPCMCEHGYAVAAAFEAQGMKVQALPPPDDDSLDIGLMNVMPFSCLPGIVVAGMAPRFRKDLDSIPWLDISFSAQGETNIKTRLEAFMYQSGQFHLRHTAT